MNKCQETIATWNKVAHLYQSMFMDLDMYDDTYDVICNASLKDKPKLLDIGCGPDNITKYLLSKRPDFEIFGIDNSHYVEYKNTGLETEIHTVIITRK
jgi:trans-aconitate methyltransferase